jgi:hypothetical protein
LTGPSKLFPGSYENIFSRNHTEMFYRKPKYYQAFCPSQKQGRVMGNLGSMEWNRRKN